MTRTPARLPTPDGRHQPGAPPPATFRALDHRFALRMTDPALRCLLERLLGALLSDGPPTTVYSWLEAGWGVRRRHAVFAGDEQVVCTPHAGAALEHLLWRINRDAVAGCAHHVLVHAGAVEQAGAAMLLPGPAGAGKTTLVAALVRKGLRYLSDEVGAIDPASLLVRPFPKPLSVKAGSWDALADLAPALDPALAPYLSTQWQVDPRRIRPDAVGRAAPGRWIVAPEYRSGAATRLMALSRGEALLTLARNAFDLRRHGKPGLEALAAVASRSRAYRLVFGGLDEACDTVLRLLYEDAVDGGENPALSSRPDPERGSGGTSPRTVQANGGESLRAGAQVVESFAPVRRAGVVSVEIDGEAVLLDTGSGTLHLLDTVATSVWSRLDGERPLGWLAADLGRHFGEDPSLIAADLMAFARDLRRRGLLDAAEAGGARCAAGPV